MYCGTMFLVASFSSNPSSVCPPLKFVFLSYRNTILPLIKGAKLIFDMFPGEYVMKEIFCTQQKQFEDSESST